MRAKVIKKPKGKERFYGRVGTVRQTIYGVGIKVVEVHFDSGEVVQFQEDELRMGVKASD